jgi:hypothetical protein
MVAPAASATKAAEIMEMLLLDFEMLLLDFICILRPTSFLSCSDFDAGGAFT